MGTARPKTSFFKIVVNFERRDDGGLRAWSAGVPGFVLSHADAKAVMDDIEPALETILSAMYETPVTVELLHDASDLGRQQSLPLSPTLPPQREYVSQLAI